MFTEMIGCELTELDLIKFLIGKCRFNICRGKAHNASITAPAIEVDFNEEFKLNLRKKLLINHVTLFMILLYRKTVKSLSPIKRNKPGGRK